VSVGERHAIVTGGGTGVGAAVARSFAAAGARVTVIGRTEGPLREVVSENAAMAAVTGDVTDRLSLEAAVNEARAGFGPIDIMVANAGVSSSKPFHRLDGADLRHTLDVNVVGTFNAFQLALEDMRERSWGRLVAIASTAGLTGYPYVSHYCASKHAVVGMVRALAHELGAGGTTANAVCPSYVDTPMTDRTIGNIMEQTGRTRDEALAALTSANPQGRLITTDEVAGTVLWLCSDSAAGVNGHAVPLAGGEL
jgi:3-hydroxybutyrate dehydrogenase